MEKILDKFERLIVLALMVFMMLAVLAATIEVAVILWQQLMLEPFLLLNVKEMMEVFGFILMVIIGLELLETIKAYLHQNVIHVEIVLLVALVAVARKIIILEYKEITPEMIFAISTLVISLSAGFFIVRKSMVQKSAVNAD